jgi:hypothetical protein
VNWASFKSSVLALLGEDTDDENPVKIRQIDQAIRSGCLRMQKLIGPYQIGHDETYGVADLTLDCYAHRGEIPDGADIQEFWRYGEAEVTEIPTTEFVVISALDPENPPVPDVTGEWIKNPLSLDAPFTYKKMVNGEPWKLEYEEGEDAYWLGTEAEALNGPYWIDNSISGNQLPSLMGPGDGVSGFISVRLGTVTEVKPADECARDRIRLHQIEWSERMSIITGTIRDRNVWVVDPRSNRFYVPKLEEGEELRLFWDGLKIDFAGNDTLPWGEEAAEAVSHFVNAQLARNSKDKMNNHQSYMNDWRLSLSLLETTEIKRRSTRS